MPNTAAEAAPTEIARRAIDRRADGATRIVRVTASGVTIQRAVSGVKMTVGVPISAYRGLVLAVREASETATLMLRHHDPDLDVALADGDAMAIAREAKAWGDLLDRRVAVEIASVACGSAIPRRVKRAGGSRFSERRKIGVAALANRSFAGEDEIIARD